MIVRDTSLSAQLDRGLAILRKPEAETFRRFQKEGGMREALIFVSAVSVVAALVAFVFGLIAGLSPFIAAVPYAFLKLLFALVTPFGAFFIFAFALNALARQQGSSFAQDEIIYTTALYAVPILGLNAAVGSIARIGCLYQPVAIGLIAYAIYTAYAFLLTDPELNQNKALTIAGGAGLALVIFLVVLGLASGAALPATSATVASCFPLPNALASVSNGTCLALLAP
jgi:hypothetical protein